MAKIIRDKMSLASGHESRFLEGKELEQQKRDFHGYKKKGLVRLSPGRWLLPSTYLKYADRIYDFEFRPSDAVVMTWAKCGTTWAQEIVWTMKNNPNLNNPMADAPLKARSPYIEFDMLRDLTDPGELEGRMLESFTKMCPGRDPNDAPILTTAECLPDPRTLKTHLPFSLINPTILDTAKVVTVLRNPKDVIVSYHHHSRLMEIVNYKGTFEDFVQYFVDDDLLYGPYWQYAKEVWAKRGHRNLHIMFFEDMKEDIVAELEKLDKFLETNLTEEQILNVARHTSFKEMQARENINMDRTGIPGFNSDVQKKDGGFFRKGVSGDWKNNFTPEMDAKVDDWIAKNMDPIGIQFRYSIEKGFGNKTRNYFSSAYHVN